MSISTLTKKLDVFVKQDLLGNDTNTAAFLNRGNRGWTEPSMRVLKSLFDILSKADNSWKGLNVAIHEIAHVSPLSGSDVSSYIPEPIRHGIIQNLKTHRIFQFKVGKRTIRIHIIYSEMHQRLSKSVILGMVRQMYLWLSITFHYASTYCASVLDVYIYLTDNIKQLPSSQLSVIDREHVNTAFTTSCKPSIDIHIFRKEEWFKVFIHETFHCFGLDFSGMDESAEMGDNVIKRHFGLKPGIDLRIYETYTETWANIMHTFIHGFLQSKTHIWENVFRSFVKSLKFEQAFSIFQCCKVLSHNKMSYRNVCARSMGAYNENSHVFSYYILKSALLFHADTFINWCIAHNDHVRRVSMNGVATSRGPLAFKQTSQNINGFSRLLVEVSCQTDYVSAVSEIERRFLYHKRLTKDRGLKEIMDTLRMTMYG